MTGPLILLAVFAIGVGWSVPGTSLSVTNLLEQARPVGTQATTQGEILTELVIPDEHISHEAQFKTPAGIAAFCTAAAGLLLATLVYWWDRGLNPEELRQFPAFKPLHNFLWNKWWFDELYDYLFVKPTHLISKFISKIDLGLIDGIIHGLAALCRGASKIVDVVFDRTIVDGTANGLARGTWDTGLWLRKIQTGSLRQYVMFIALGTILLFVAISFVQNI
jgi:NADH-quinone oxidoreductase subunit L